jgi:predicted transcriptional regulator
LDRVLSARINEEVAILLDALSRKHHKSKKRILEEALRDMRNAEAMSLHSTS